MKEKENGARNWNKSQRDRERQKKNGGRGSPERRGPKREVENYIRSLHTGGKECSRGERTSGITKVKEDTRKKKNHLREVGRRRGIGGAAK